jgi:prepilin-type N-terminal cleavage/methylation domain-containing protein
MNEYMEDRNEKGFTLIELLVAIVVVGILTAVAIVGIAGLTDKGGKSACATTADAARAAATVHFANTGSYPDSFADMTSPTPPELEVSSDLTQGATTLDGTGWTLTMAGGGGATAPTFTCGP